MTILIVEDEDTIREVEKAYVLKEGFKAIEAADGEQALKLFKENKVDLVVLDLNLPKINGIEVCKTIRQHSAVPIIMVTARSEEIDEIIGLQLGADDYIKKPFSPSILIARIQALLRRNKSEEIIIGLLTINPEKMTVTKSGEKITLTTTQFNILYTLANNPGRVYTREEIMDLAYKDNLTPDILDRTIDAHIKSIRKSIEKDTTNPEFILTVIGKGYKFNDEIK